MHLFGPIAERYISQGGTFCVPPSDFLARHARIKAIVFDWDGVFNDGSRHGQEGSTFTEPDAMGTNMLRFSHWLAHRQLPVIGIITGEKNRYALSLTERERFHSLYFRIAHKKQAFDHFLQTHHLQPAEVAFVFDDILDFSVAEVCGLRLQVRRKANPLLNDYVVHHHLMDYASFSESGAFAVREVCELLIGATGNFHETLRHRSNYDARYQEYLALRKATVPAFFTAAESAIVSAAGMD